MKMIKTLATAAIALALMLVPATALAKRDRDHDRMPDRWEKRHHLNTRVNDARRDPDRDGLRNLAEFRHHTDPHDADTDDDGIEDDNEVSGTIASFENGILTIQLPGDGAGTVTGAVNSSTEIECEDEHATASHDGEDRSGPGEGDDDDHEDEDEDERNCTAADLKPGAHVREAEFTTAADGSKTFTEVELS